MASIEYITKRIEGKQKDIEKLRAKMTRIRKAEATGWEVNPYYYNANDIRITLRDITAAEAALEKWQAELAAAQEKAQSRNVPAITEFLDGWKDRMTQFYGSAIHEYYTERDRIRKMRAEAGQPWQRNFDAKKYDEALAAGEALGVRRSGRYEWQDYERIDRFGNVRKGKEHVKVENGDLEYAAEYLTFLLESEAMAKLESVLRAEYDRKYDFIIERTNAIVGQITDASGLYVGSKGDLNGLIVGTKGVARVMTVGAGGWNIQCFHFRTLINRA